MTQAYSLGKTIWKAFWTFVQGTVGVGAGVLAIKLPETAGEFAEAWPALLAPLGFAIWKALENYRKNSDSAYDSRPRWVWPWNSAPPESRL